MILLQWLAPRRPGSAMTDCSPTPISLAKLRLACGNCSLHELCLPVGIGLDDVDRLDRIVKRRRPSSRGDHVFRLGDEFRAVYAIRAGSVKTYTTTEGGGEQVTGFHLPGELIGLDAIHTGIHPSSAKVLETTSLCEIPFDHLEELSAVIPSLGRQLIRIMSREIHSDDELLTLLGKKSAEERLAALLISLSNRLQQRGFSAREFHLSMSRNDIGNYLGLAVETVSRLFTRFQQLGLVTANNKHIRIERLEDLRALATGSSTCQPRG